ncbi:unnamed protein product [Durusdinium trenchii]|uniref:F-box domain-containing protein n=3 Tax=Durusdinium trenchii TaxID=1381693 RepID=A0ABP0MG11_9DINO
MYIPSRTSLPVLLGEESPHSTAMASGEKLEGKQLKGGSISIRPIPDECWTRVLGNLEATELSTCSVSCLRFSRLSDHPELWQALLRSDFCASLTHRAMLLAWMAMHHHFHPRQLYIFKRREHLLDLEIARADLCQRYEQAREQDRKQRRLRALNYFLVRVIHCLLCISVLASSILLWLKLKDAVTMSYYLIFSPVLGFESVFFIAASMTFLIYFQRSSTGWTFYWNRLQGTVRWFILFTSPCEGFLVLFFAGAALPLLAATLEEDLPVPWPSLRVLPPFLAVWLGTGCFAFSVLRRRQCSSSCIGSCLFLWCPLAAFSTLLFSRLTVWPWLSPMVMMLPLLLVTCMLILFSSFLTIASFWLGWRGSRDWMEYATTTLLAILAFLLPMLTVEITLVCYLKGACAIHWVFAPWTLWLTGLSFFALYQSCLPLKPNGLGAPHLDRLPNRYRRHDLHSDTELLLPQP